MVTFLVVLFVFICISMVIVILLQSSKGQGLAGTFGGSGASAVFGGRGAATFLSKATAVLAVTYMVLCLLIGLKKNVGVNGGHTYRIVELVR